MKAPDFWWSRADRPGWQARLLVPATLFWRAGAALRALLASPERTSVPVLCIGNLTAGGTGKSPMVAALRARLTGRGIAAHIVSRGHGGRIPGPHLVDELRDSHRDVGDEPLMLASGGPVWVARDRAAGVRAAAEAGAAIVLLDDGFQNPGLIKDAAILMIDAVQGFGNGRLIPAGPLREPVADGLDRADLAVLVGRPPERDAAMARWPEIGWIDTVGAEIVPQQTGLPIDGEAVVAFAGIGRPEKFFDTLRDMGAVLHATHAFPDHHDFPPAILRRLVAEARGADAMLVTTEKDAVRLPPAFRSEVLTVQVRMEPEDWAPIDALVERLITETP